MILPEGIQRENNKLYEEVRIPYSEPMPVGFEEKPVYIQDLDEVRWALFTFYGFEDWMCYMSRFVSEKLFLKVVGQNSIETYLVTEAVY